VEKRGQRHDEEEDENREVWLANIVIHHKSDPIKGGENKKKAYRITRQAHDLVRKKLMVRALVPNCVQKAPSDREGG